ncbi:hypothetical protein CLAVI_000904 [Candidatus Clavichlamydia salmonicola]|uniref:hypothetical protein n=1 Tax=Candidatus Clavichlamydia salmonicola TaxID=469812 RepID=UPI001891D307|nr:hypothetical protein [Candidatus Clavichlamydia salmonicola]MBF5051263.1 hypothetical protein [Candidatus Clavichlamydia salmonicola]
MIIPINPFSIQTILVKQDTTILLIHRNLVLQDTHEKQDHLHNLAHQVRQAAIQGYSLSNACLSTKSTKTGYTHPLSFTQNLSILAQQLKTWLQENNQTLISSFGGTFYQKILQSLDLEAPIVPTHSVSPTPQSQNPKKRWRMAYEKASMSPPKQAKMDPEKHAFPSDSSQVITLALEKMPSFLTTDITMLQESVFTFIQKETYDLEAWITKTHQQVANVITNSDIFFVNSESEISSIPYIKPGHLRKITLKSLLQFMEQHLHLLNNIFDSDIKKEAHSSHITLIKDLKIALQYTQQCLHISNESQSPVLEKSTNLKMATLKKSPCIIAKRFKKLSTPKIFKQILPEHYFIGLRCLASCFSLSSKASIYSIQKFRNFLKIVYKASKLSSYASNTTIPNISNNISHDRLTSLKTLYHIVHRNFYCFPKLHHLTTNLKSLEQAVLETLSFLNSEYCSEIGFNPDPLHHHDDLLVSLISDNNLPSPIFKKSSLSYISIYPHPNNHNVLLIKKILLQTPINNKKQALTTWLKSLSKHKLRLINAIKQSQHQSIYLKCNDNSWPLDHDTRSLKTHKTLLPVLKKISLHNLKTCLHHFKSNSELDDKVLSLGRENTEQILTSIIDILNNPNPALPSSPQDSLTSTPLMLMSRENDLTNSFQFFSIFRPDTDYVINIHSVFTNLKLHNIKSLFCHAKKTTHHVKNMLSFERAINIQYNQHIITDVNLCIPLIYWGVQYNHVLLQTNYEDTFSLKKKHMTQAKYNNTLFELEKIQTFLLEEWKKRTSENTPVTPLNDLKHPLQNSLTILYKELEIKIMDQLKNYQKNIDKLTQLEIT